MIVYRLSSSRYSRDLSGRGAEQHGGRWNCKGTPMVYASSSRALCMAELAVHLSLANLPVDYVMLTIEIPDDAFSIVKPEDLPAGWKSFPYQKSVQQVGERFITEQSTLVLQVPSAVVPGDMNYLINPLHPDIHKVKVVEITPFEFDSRLQRR